MSEGIQRIHPGPLTDAIYRLRVDAWAADDVIFPDARNGRLVDGLDGAPDVENYGYLDRGQLVGAIRISVHASSESMPFPEPLRISPTESPIGFISRLSVHPDWRRRGVGYKLIDYSLVRLRELQVKGILAYTPVMHVSRYMESHGFTVYRTASIQWGQRQVPATGFYIAL